MTMSLNDQVIMPVALFGKKGLRGNFLRVPPWLRSILGIPLEMKLLGANLVIVIVAILLLEATPVYQGGSYVFAVALIVGAAVNFALVKLALRPIDALEHVARRVSEGHLGERVPTSLVADRGLAHLS